MSEQWIAMPLSALGFALQLANEKRTTSLDESNIRRRPQAVQPNSPALSDANEQHSGRPSPTVIVDPALYSKAHH